MRFLPILPLIALAAGGWYWRSAIYERLHLLYWQRQCMRYRAPADQVVFTQDPEVGMQLLALGEDYGAMYPSVRSEETSRLTRDATQPPEYVWYKPRVWAEFPAGRWEPGPAFLHARRSNAGEMRLVALELSDLGGRLTFLCRAMTPASLFDEGKLSRRGNSTYVGIYHLNSPDCEAVTLYAGQPVPGDAAAFTIRCDIGSRSGVLEGRLRDDGQISLLPREPWLQELWGEGFRASGRRYPPAPRPRRNEANTSTTEAAEHPGER